MTDIERSSVSEAMRNLFSFFDPHKNGFITAPQVQLLHEEIRMGGISMPQVLASMEYKNLDKHRVHLYDLPDLLQEMDRRYFLIQDLQWEYAMLDRDHVGAIPIDTARFLMEARHGKTFSERSWERLLSTRPVPEVPISFAEMEVDLCNIMQPDLHKAREAEEKIKLRNKVQAAKRDSRQKLELQQKQNEEAKRTADENERKLLEAQKKEREEEQRRKMEEERLRLSEDRKRNEEDAELKNKEAEEEEAMALQQEKMLREAAKKQQNAEKRKQAEKEAREAAKKAEAARKKKIRAQLKVAVESRNREKLAKATKDFKGAQLSDDDGDLAKAERLLAMFMCSDELRDGISKRLVEKLEAGLHKAKKSGFDKGELSDLVAQADELLARLRRLEKLRHEVLELKSSTIAEIRSYKQPPTVVHDVMMATYLLLGTPFKETKKWTNVQVLLAKTGKESLKRRIGQFNVSNVDHTTASKAKSQMGQIDLEMIRDVSAGAATFYVWVDGMVEEILVGDE